MDGTDRLNALFVRSRSNTVLSWLFIAVLVGSGLFGAQRGRYEPVLFAALAIAIVAGPAVALRDPALLPPWYFLALICLPVVAGALIPRAPAKAFFPTLALATLGLLAMVELQLLTTLRLVPWFAVALTVLFTLALAAVLNVLRWSADVLFGTSFLLDGRSQNAINAAVMVELVQVVVAGVVAGVVFREYFRRTTDLPDARMKISRPLEDETPAESATISDRLGVSATRQRQLVRAMQVVLVGILAYGVWARRLPLLVNAGVALAITFLPAVLERDYGIPIEPGLALWLTSAVFFHAIGSAGLYTLIPSWDTLTHTLSATVVAAAGYTTLRAIHIHADSVHLPPWAMFSLTVVFVLAMGVVWEILEFFVDRSARLLGLDTVPAQHGIDDTIVDLVFDGVGAVLVAAWGTVYLTNVSEWLAVLLDNEYGD